MTRPDPLIEEVDAMIFTPEEEAARKEAWDMLEDRPKPFPCSHDLAERETACADGICPICLQAALSAVIAEVAKKDAEIDALKADLEALRLVLLWEEST